LPARRRASSRPRSPPRPFTRRTRKIKAGTICVNSHNYGDPAWPFGGFKQSGWGREMGKEVMEHYTETKSVAINLV
jgi:phenylacetaldehyde dehydrogenase